MNQPNDPSKVLMALAEESAMGWYLFATFAIVLGIFSGILIENHQYGFATCLSIWAIISGVVSAAFLIREAIYQAQDRGGK